MSAPNGPSPSNWMATGGISQSQQSAASSLQQAGSHMSPQNSLPGMPRPVQSQPNVSVQSSLGLGFGNQVAPNTSQSFPLAGGEPTPNGMQHGGPMSGQHPALPNQQMMKPVMGQSVLSLPAPLAKNVFENAFKSYCQRANMKLEQGWLQIENRTIDLHSLHTHVMQEGGFSKVCM